MSRTVLIESSIVKFLIYRDPCLSGLSRYILMNAREYVEKLWNRECPFCGRKFRRASTMHIHLIRSRKSGCAVRFDVLVKSLMREYIELIDESKRRNLWWTKWYATT